MELHQTSQWMNQAQILRPHFWAYLQGEGHVSQPMFALRLYGAAESFGVSLEVSFLERKKDEATLNLQAKVLSIAADSSIYYFVQEGNEQRRVEMTEENRSLLRKKLVEGQIRKVLIKKDVPIQLSQSLESFIRQLEVAYCQLLPYYQATRK